jgi:hypothetical protein
VLGSKYVLNYRIILAKIVKFPLGKYNVKNVLNLANIMFTYLLIEKLLSNRKYSLIYKGPYIT